MPAFAPPFSDRVAHTWTATQTFDPADNTTAIAISGFSLTGSSTASMADLSGTWNTSGAPSALKIGVTDTASATASLLLDLQVGGASRFSVRKDGSVTALDLISGGGNGYNITNDGFTRFKSSGYIGFTATSNAANVVEVALYRDAANTFGQRNGTNAQGFRLYNTYTSGTNYERLGINWGSNLCTITTEAQTGTVRPLNVKFPPQTVASLPSASTAGAGSRMMVSDASAPTFGATAAGGGSTVSPVYSDGSNWKIG